MKSMHFARIRPALVCTLFGAVLICACGHTPQFYLDKGNRLASGQRFPDAVLNYRRAIQLNPRLAEAHYRLGLAELRLHKDRDAVAELQQAAELDPKRQELKVALGDIALAACLSVEVPPPPAYNLLSRVTNQIEAETPNSFAALRYRGYLAILDKRYRDTEAYFEHANEIKPMQADVVLAWVGVLLNDGRAAEAEALGQRLIAVHPTFTPMYDQLATYYARTGRAGEAESVLKLKVRNNPRDAAALMQLAAFYGQTGRQQQADALVQRMCADTATFPQARLYAGDLYLRLGRVDAADSMYKEGADRDRTNRILYLKRIANLWLAEGRGEKAAGVVSEILRANPGDMAAQAVNAALLLRSGDPQKAHEAAEAFRSLVKADPQNAVWRLNLGLALLPENRTDDARKELKEALRMREDFLPPRFALAQIAESQGDFETVLHYDEEILNVNPSLPMVNVQRAAALISLGRYGEAERVLANLEGVLPSEVSYQRARLALKQRKFEQAEEGFRAVLKKQPENAEALAGVVETLSAEKKPGIALAFIKSKIAGPSVSDAVRIKAAELSLQTGHFTYAIEQYRFLLQEHPDAAGLHVQLGSTYRAEGDLSDCVRELEEASRLAPNDGTPAALLGEAYAAHGKAGEAIRAYRHALQLRSDPAVMNDLAYLLAENGGDLNEATELARKALELQPGQANVLDTLGWIYQKRNLTQAAAQIFSGLVQKHPSEPAFRYHFALVLLQEGNRNDCKLQLRTALAAHPPAELRESIESTLSGLT